MTAAPGPGEADPYRLAGLRGNPFLAEPGADSEPGLFLDRGAPPPPEPGRRIFFQVLGPKGSGKTTLLNHWRRVHPGPYTHVPPGPGRFLPPAAGRVSYWDEADRIPGLVRGICLRIASRRRGTVVAGSHRDLGRAAAAAGFAVRTYALPAATPEDILRWARQRILRAGLDSKAPPDLEVPPSLALAVSREAGHCWRTVGDRLHSWAAGEAARRAQSPARGAYRPAQTHRTQ